MPAPRNGSELGPWEIFGLTVFGAGVVTAGALSWRWSRRGPPHAAKLHPTGTPPDPVELPEPHPKAGSKSSGYEPSWGPVPDAGDWAQVPKVGPGYMVRNPSRTWGTTASVQSVVDAMARFEERRASHNLLDPKTLEPLVGRLGDMSKKGGGPLPPHKSHQRGRDLDMSFLKGRRGRARLPMPALAFLLWAFLQDDNTSGIFLDWNLQREVWEALDMNPELAPGLKAELQYPLAPHTGRTRVRHWPGHANHIHVRFRT